MLSLSPDETRPCRLCRLPNHAVLFGAKIPIYQKDDRADDALQQPCPFAGLIPTYGLAEVGRGKRPDDAEDGGQDKAL